MPLRNFLRIYSYIFEAIFCAMGLLLAGFTILSRNVDVTVPWLPWKGPHAPLWIGVWALVGLACVGLAVAGKLRTLLFLFSGAVVYVLVRGLFLDTQYSFGSPAEARNAAILVAGALVAFIGAQPFWTRARRPR